MARRHQARHCPPPLSCRARLCQPVASTHAGAPHVGRIHSHRDNTSRPSVLVHQRSCAVPEMRPHTQDRRARTRGPREEGLELPPPVRCVRAASACSWIHETQGRVHPSEDGVPALGRCVRARSRTRWSRGRPRHYGALAPGPHPHPSA